MRNACYDEFLSMRRHSTLLLFALLCLFPLSAGAERVHEKWLFRTEAEIEKWNAAGITQGSLGPDGLTLAVSEQGALFRELPEGFHEKVDALKIYIGPSTLDEVALLLLTMNEKGDIVKRFRLTLNPDASTLADGEYVPLTFYRPDIAGTEVLAISFKGNAESVDFFGVRFLDYSLWEKIAGGWRSFWHLDPFRPHTINLLIGPLIVPDPSAVQLREKSLVSLSTSVNAYLLVFLSLAGIGFLFAAALKARKHGTPWPVLRAEVCRRFFLLLLGTWLLYDFRMGLEFLAGVAEDHRQYIAADASLRTFRDRGRFYDFASFAREFVADRQRYEVFLPDAWPYFGLLRYETLPSLPNPGEPISDTWVIYERPDVTVGKDQRLHLAGEAITKPGQILGHFGSGSFVFREET